MYQNLPTLCTLLGLYWFGLIRKIFVLRILCSNCNFVHSLYRFFAPNDKLGLKNCSKVMEMMRNRLNKDTFEQNQSKSPPPSPISSSSYYLGASTFFAAYFLGYYFFFYWTAGFDPAFPEAAGADPELPILVRPLAMSLLTSLPFKVSMSLLRSASVTLTLEDPRTFLISAAARIMKKIYRCLFCLRGKGERKQPNTSWC